MAAKVVDVVWAHRHSTANFVGAVPDDLTAGTKEARQCGDVNPFSYTFLFYLFV